MLYTILIYNGDLLHGCVRNDSFSLFAVVCCFVFLFLFGKKYSRTCVSFVIMLIQTIGINLSTSFHCFYFVLLRMLICWGS